VYDRSMSNSTEPLVSATSFALFPFSRRLILEDLTYSRLPDSYYAPGNSEKNARVKGEFPDLGTFTLSLVRPNIMAVTPTSVDCYVEFRRHRIDFNTIRLVWPEKDEKMKLDGFCYVDLDKQVVYGEVEGLARQRYIRPLLVSLDVPVSLPYMDAFTEVTEPVPSWCAWNVNLINNDFDLYLDLHPDLGKYQGVPMRHVDGKIHLHNFIRGHHLNYRQTIGPIVAIGPNGENLEGSVIVSGTNGQNKVEVKAQSALPVADILRIGGFTGDYVGPEVVGESSCDLEFRFPRAMTNNYEVLNGRGHVEIRNGQLMRMKGFRGLLAAMPQIAPAVSWFTDSTQATCDYVITNGVVKTDNCYIEGSFFSLQMTGEFDAVRNTLDYKVLVQFSQKDSWLGKVLHPLTWPFSKLLLEFRMTGTPESPEWKYVSVVDRVVDRVMGAKE